jgi:hypothetical protein
VWKLHVTPDAPLKRLTFPSEKPTLLKADFHFPSDMTKSRAGEICRKWGKWKDMARSSWIFVTDRTCLSLQKVTRPTS